MALSDLIKQIKNDEQFRARRYLDSEGYPTIGYGTKLPLSAQEIALVSDPENLTEEEADKLLFSRLSAMMKELNAVKGEVIEKLSDNRKEVIYNMLYQLGVKGLLGFKRMWLALEAGDYAKAADEMKDSKWYYQTPARAKRLIDKMLEG
ncbi:MAG: glycoside hydrolase family protein [Campylobacteraceae bacterium]|jgi:lysozyme|nr:glycoside hydrolase family protein [Campylobacteraceae bacterium]